MYVNLSQRLVSIDDRRLGRPWRTVKAIEERTVAGIHPTVEPGVAWYEFPVGSGDSVNRRELLGVFFV